MSRARMRRARVDARTEGEARERRGGGGRVDGERGGGFERASDALRSRERSRRRFDENARLRTRSGARG